MRGLYYLTTVLILIDLFASQTSYALPLGASPFSTSDSKIGSAKGFTNDDKLLVNLEYSPKMAKRGELTFFKINLFNNSGDDKQVLVRHVDCDFIISKDKRELFKISTQYGEPFYHTISGVFLASFPFNETGRYSLSVEVVSITFIPIKPTFANFSAVVLHTQNGNVIKIST